MNNKDNPSSISDKGTAEPLAILANTVQNGALYDNTTFNREPAPFQQLIANEHAHLPPSGGAQFGVSQQFVTQFPTYMHTVPTGLYSLSMVEEHGDNSGKRRRRTNYRDPENAAKLTTALGILIKQKEENKPQDLKSIASHFGLPYNTLRDNYLKVTTGRLLKERVNEKRPAVFMKTDLDDNSDPASKMAKKVASVPRPGGSGNSSAANTPRERSSSSSAAPQMTGVPFVNTHGGVTQTYAPYPVFHPQVGMHFMPQLGMQNLQHMQHLPNGGVVTTAPTMHHPMLNGGPQMMHMFAPAPVGYQINPANGRPFPIFAAPSANNNNNALNSADLQLQMQGQLMNPGMLAMTLPVAVNPPTPPSANAVDGNAGAVPVVVGEQSPHSSTAATTTNATHLTDNNNNNNNTVSAPISAPVTQLMMPSNLTTNSTLTNNSTMPVAGTGMYIPAPMSLMPMNMPMNMPMSMPMSVPMQSNMQGGMFAHAPQMVTLGPDGVFNVSPNQFAQNFQNMNQNASQNNNHNMNYLPQQQQLNNNQNSTASLLAAALSAACGPELEPQDPPDTDKAAKEHGVSDEAAETEEQKKNTDEGSDLPRASEEGEKEATKDDSAATTSSSIISASTSAATIAAPATSPPQSKKAKDEKKPSPQKVGPKATESDKRTTNTAAARVTPVGTRRK